MLDDVHRDPVPLGEAERLGGELERVPVRRGGEAQDRVVQRGAPGDELAEGHRGDVGAVVVEAELGAGVSALQAQVLVGHPGDLVARAGGDHVVVGHDQLGGHEPPGAEMRRRVDVVDLARRAAAELRDAQAGDRRPGLPAEAQEVVGHRVVLVHDRLGDLAELLGRRQVRLAGGLAGDLVVGSL